MKIIADADQRAQRINAKSSVIYSADADTLVLAQTEPSVKSTMLGKEIMVTFVAREGEKYSRYGFSAVVTELVDRYELSPEEYARAVVVRMRSNPKPYDIRMCYRVGPSSRSGLDVFVCGEKVTLIDISLGGMRFSYSESPVLEPHQVVEVRLGIAPAVYPIQARVIRIRKADKEGSGKGLRFAAAEFLNVTGKIEQVLSRKILDIERESPFAGKSDRYRSPSVKDVRPPD
ncbi:MAG TPA: PilZ domain-containing protein [Syntrophorhabdales bacterium]|nr:PilZ domain-containing protein [Syntrophorhabdales bacterium]